MNETTNEKNFKNLTVAQLIGFAQSENIDDNELSARLARRIFLTVQQNLTCEVPSQELKDLVEVTDRDLHWIATQAAADAADEAKNNADKAWEPDDEGEVIGLSELVTTVTVKWGE
jgi:predicted transcriptional regulator